MKSAANGSGLLHDSFSLLCVEHAPTNGRIHYRVGKICPLKSEIAFSELWEKKQCRYLAGNAIKIANDNDLLRIYGTSHDSDNNFYDFKMTIEPQSDGSVIAEVQMTRDGRVSETIEGLVFKDAGDKKAALENLSSNTDNKILMETSNGTIELNLGVVDYLIVECGTIAKDDPKYKTKHVGDTLTFFSADQHQYDDFSSWPIAKIKQSRIATKFSPNYTRHTFSNGQTSGHISAIEKGFGFER